MDTNSFNTNFLNSSTLCKDGNYTVDPESLQRKGYLQRKITNLRNEHDAESPRASGVRYWPIREINNQLVSLIEIDIFWKIFFFGIMACEHIELSNISQMLSVWYVLWGLQLFSRSRCCDAPQRIPSMQNRLYGMSCEDCNYSVDPDAVTRRNEYLRCRIGCMVCLVRIAIIQ